MLMNNDNQYIRFDWTVKRMMRDKANFGMLEGPVKRNIANIKI